MSRGFVDSGTMSNLVQAFDRGSSANNNWTSKSLTVMTQLLIQSDHWNISPGIQTHVGFPSDDQSKLIDGLAKVGAIKHLEPISAADMNAAIKKSRKWAGRTENIDKVRQSLKTVKGDHGFEDWFDWLKHNALLIDAQRKGYFLDATFELPIAKVLLVDPADLKNLREKSNDPPELQMLLKRDNSDFRLLRDAYLCSAIIRGRFHYEISRSENLHIVQHQIREPLLEKHTRAGSEFPVSNMARAVTKIVIDAALWQPSLDHRINCWVDNIDRVRRLIRSDPTWLNDRQEGRVDEAAADFAKKANIHFARKKTAGRIDLAITGLIELAGFWFNGWSGVAVGMGVDWTRRQINISGDTMLNSFHLRTDHLKKLAAGPVFSRWQRDSGE